MKALDILKQEARNGEQVIGPEESRLQYEGRIDFGKEAGPLWTFPATSVAARFRGSRLEVLVTNYHAYWDNQAPGLLPHGTDPWFPGQQ